MIAMELARLVRETYSSATVRQRDTAVAFDRAVAALASALPSMAPEVARRETAMALCGVEAATL
jgi:hypothetical protein